MSDNEERNIGLQDADSEEEEDIEWLLGFVEPPLDKTDLLRHRFPSKVGGRPAWLDPVHLPSIEDLTCASNGKLVKFLLQVYAPLDQNPSAFHRTVFVFVSTNGPAIYKSPGSVKALRCQLPRSNPYYGYDPPSEGKICPPAIDENVAVRDPWLVALHEQHPNDAMDGDEVDLFPELELVVEPEPEQSGKGVDELLERAEAYVSKYTEEELPGDILDTLEEAMPEEQRHFAAFATRTSLEPSQVLRYCFEDNVRPLCPSSKGIPSPDSIPPCPHCHGPRKFEFQIMPQLLNSLLVDPSDPNSPDWGTIAVYSCATSCTVDVTNLGSAYVEEYVWVQPPS